MVFILLVLCQDLLLAGRDALRRQVLAQASASSIALYQSLRPINLLFLAEKTKAGGIFQKSRAGGIIHRLCQPCADQSLRKKLS